MRGSAPTLSVSEFVAVFNQSLDIIFPSIGVVGELANFRISKGAWVYFDLKDDTASVKFFGSVRSLPGPLEDGMMLEVHGRPFLHPRFGFSVQVETVKPVGSGVIKKAKDLLKVKLEREGLFDDSRKRYLEYPPSSIALITSGESAAYSDFIKIINERWPYLGLTLFDIQVQGENAPDQILDAINRINLAAEYEVIVLVRGGGSADDLLAFDDERVVRAIATSRAATMVAIGHERDVSLAELAADKRASTPSNAAELLVPERINEIQQLRVYKNVCDQALLARVKQARSIASSDQKAAQESIGYVLQRAFEDIRSTRILIDALNPRKIEDKGFVLIRDELGTVLKTAKAVRNAGDFVVDFRDDPIKAKVQ